MWPSMGTRSVLCGVHQCFWHPATVIFAWRHLYKEWPDWRTTICIIVHDLGYWGKPNIDGQEGDTHPEGGALLAHALLDPWECVDVPSTCEEDSGWHELRQKNDYLKLCLYHSRHYAAKAGGEPSKLCWADKYSCAYDPWWFYLSRSWLTGEIWEQRKMWADEGRMPITATHREWYAWAQKRSIDIGLSLGKVHYKLHRDPGSQEDQA